MNNNHTLLTIKHLCTEFVTGEGRVRAVDDVSYSVRKGETLALVGESGCGKSVTALSILRLIPEPPGKIVAGTIRFEGINLLGLSKRQMREIRGNQIAMIFQEPQSSLNPVYSVGDQILEAIRLHRDMSGQSARQLVVESLRQVGIPAPEQRVNDYPHQMSGGMRQRVMIAMALSCEPELLIADEPTTALDVTIQAQILDLLEQLRQQRGMSILLITHDLGVVAQSAQRVAVMYASKIVEFADVDTLFSQPKHPYTHGLFNSLPCLGGEKTRLDVIPGSVPNPVSFPSGCKFHPRCPLGSDDRRCQSQEPPLREVSPGQWCACWKVEGFEASEETLPVDAE